MTNEVVEERSIGYCSIRLNNVKDLILEGRERIFTENLGNRLIVRELLRQYKTFRNDKGYNSLLANFLEGYLAD